MKSSSFLQSLRHALCGWMHLVRRERNARIHVVAAALVAALAAWLRVGRTEAALLALAVGMVVMAEAINTSIESVVDLLSPERRESARIAKDVAAAAVLTAAATAIVAGALILGPPLWRRLAM